MPSAESRSSFGVYGSLPHPDFAHINYFSDFEITRSVLLGNTPRFESIKEMTHRTSVMEHTLRVTGIALQFSSMLLELGQDHQQKAVLFHADHHDDEEIITGDIPTPVKRGASDEERQRMEEEAIRAAERIKFLVATPTFIEDYEVAFKEYKAQQTLDTRIVHLADKIDGLHEAIHEVVCGDNKEQFRGVIRDYREEFGELAEKNVDWIPDCEEFLGKDFFEFPDPDLLPSKTAEELDYADAGSFIESIAESAPPSYLFWLKTNRSIYRISFLPRTFPGWDDRWPKELAESIWAFDQGARLVETKTGLIIPVTSMKHHEFAKSLDTGDAVDTWVTDKGDEVREKTGATRSSDDFWFMHT